MTSKLKGLLHIGMPKCMSTSIQAYLSEAKSTFFMGMGPSKDLDSDVLYAFQRQIVATPTHLYDRAGVARIFDRFVSQAMDQHSRLFAFSDETIPYPLGYGRMDTSYTERLQRLREVMPENTQVLMITRQPEDYLKSTYKHRMVMNGMTFTFDEYVKRLLLLGDTYLLATAKFFDYAQEAKRIFGNIRVIAMEEIMDDPDVLLSYFAGLGVEGGGNLPHENTGMSSDKLENFRRLIAPYGNTLADDDFNVMSPANRRICRASKGYFSSVFAQVLGKDDILTTLRTLAIQLPGSTSTATFELSDETRRRLKEYLVESNAGLRAQYGLDTGLYCYDDI